MPQLSLQDFYGPEEEAGASHVVPLQVLQRALLLNPNASEGERKCAVPHQSQSPLERN